MATHTDIAEGIYFPDLHQSASIDHHNKVRVFEGNGEHVVSLEFELVVFTGKGDLSEDELGWRYISDAVVGGGVEQRCLSEAFEGGLAYDLHDYFIPQAILL